VLREVHSVLGRRGVSARVVLDCDPNYGPYIAVETELRASEALDLWMELVQACRGFGVFVAVSWVEDDLPRYEVLHRLAKILAESGLKLRFAESSNVAELVRELRGECRAASADRSEHAERQADFSSLAGFHGLGPV